MTISFPTTPPTTPKPSRIQFFQMGAVAVSKSPYSSVSQAVEWDAGLWGAAVTYPPMKRATAAPLIAWLTALRCNRGTFYLGPVQLGTILGAGGGTPKVKGASQVGYTLITDGWPNSTLVLKAGDMLGIGSSIYMNLTDATSSGAGEVTLDIWPNARNHADNADLDLTAPKCVMRLIDSTVIPFEEGTDKWFSISFTAEEVK